LIHLQAPRSDVERVPKRKLTTPVAVNQSGVVNESRGPDGRRTPSSDFMPITEQIQINTDATQAVKPTTDKSKQQKVLNEYTFI